MIEGEAKIGNIGSLCETKAKWQRVPSPKAGNLMSVQPGFRGKGGWSGLEGGVRLRYKRREGVGVEIRGTYMKNPMAPGALCEDRM